MKFEFQGCGVGDIFRGAQSTETTSEHFERFLASHTILQLRNVTCQNDNQTADGNVKWEPVARPNNEIAYTVMVVLELRS